MLVEQTDAPRPLPDLERLLLRLSRTRAMPIWARWSTTTALIFVGFGLRAALFGFGPAYPSLLFFPIIVVAAAFFDRGTGFYAVALSTLLIVGSLNPIGLPAAITEQDLLGVLLYVGLALLTAQAMERLHAMLAAMLDANRRLARENAEKAVALREVMHRTRNDLHILAATIARQSAAAVQADVKAALRETEARLVALSRVSRRLDTGGGMLGARVDAAEFLSGLVADMREALVDLRPIALEVTAEPHALSLAHAVSLGVILNELVTNALKYAFPGDQSGIVHVDLRCDEGTMVLAVVDNGAGLDAGASPQGTGLGQQVARSVAAQLGGTLDIGTNEDGEGTSCVMRFAVE